MIPNVGIDTSCGGLCSELLADHQLTVIESGYMTPMLKDPRFFRFVAWAEIPLEDRPDDAINTRVFVHQECFQSNLGELEEEIVAEDDRNSRHCDLCRRKFDAYHRVFRVTEWCPMPDTSVENGRPEFVLDATVDNVLLCPSCLKRIFGEGDEEEGDALINEWVRTD